MIYQLWRNRKPCRVLNVLTKKMHVHALIVAVVLIPLAFMTPLASSSAAIVEDGIYSLFWNVDFKDGDKLNNWDDALEISLVLANTSLEATLYAKNDWNVFYLGFLLEGGFVLTSNTTTIVTLYWDANNDHLKANDVKEMIINVTNDSTDITKNDYFVSSLNNVVLDQGGTEFSVSVSSVSFGQSTRDLLEVKIPLTTDDPLEDFQVYQPEDFPLGLGIRIEHRTNGTLDFSTGWNVNFSDFIDASSYATFILAGPADVKIPAYQQTIPGETVGTTEVIPSEEHLRETHEAAGGVVPGWDFLNWFLVILAGGVLTVGVRYRKTRKVGDYDEAI